MVDELSLLGYWDGSYEVRCNSEENQKGLGGKTP